MTLASADGLPTALQQEWRRSEPLAELIETFLSPAARHVLPCWALLLGELEEAALDLSEAHIAQVKLGWWAEELQYGLAGSARHPLVQALFGCDLARRLSDADWSSLVHGAASLAASEVRPSSVAAQLERFMLFSRPAARLEASLFGTGDIEQTARTHAVHLALNQMLLPRRRQRQPWPMDLVARFGLSPAQEGADGSSVLQFVREHARQLAVILTGNAHSSLYRATAGVSRSIILRRVQGNGLAGPFGVRPSLRSAWSVWRAARRARP